MCLAHWRGFAARRSRGFSLIEVMVAVVVLSVGLLGVAKMEALSLSSTTVASMRALAALEASSLGAAMHENRGYWAKSPDPTSATIQVKGQTVTVVNSAPLLAAAPLGTCATGGSACNCEALALPCSITNMAAYDLQTWAKSLSDMLPNDVATIVCSNLTPRSCTVNIVWSENAVAINGTDASNGTEQFQNPSYTLYVEP